MFIKLSVIAIISFLSLTVNAQENVRKPDQQLPTYKITKESPAGKNATTLTIDVVNGTGSPIAGRIVLYDKKLRPSLYVETDKEGRSVITLIDNRFAGYLFVEALGHMGVKIPLSELKGKNVCVRATLIAQVIVD